MSGRCSSTLILRSLGRGFLAGMRFFTLSASTLLMLLGGMRPNVLWRMHRNCSQTRPRPCLPWVIINIRCCVITGLAETTFDRVSKMLPGSSEARRALGLIARREGKWGESIAYFEQALALDPRNVELLVFAADTYAMLRQFPAALKLYDRALDIMPDVPDTIGAKVSIYQAQGDLQEAAKFLSAINAQTPSGIFYSKIRSVAI